jgi:AcrR family transcriptional regulator
LSTLIVVLMKSPLVAGRSDKTSEARTRIFDALLSWAGTTGLRKLSMDDVARRARVGRATLYKYFPGREALIDAFVRHQLDEFFQDVESTVERYSDPEDRLVHGFAHAYRLLRHHRALGPVLRLNPELLMPYVISEQSYALDVGRTFVERFASIEGLSPALRAQFSEHVARAFHTLMLIPSSVMELDAPGGPENYARNFLIPVKKHLMSLDAD